MTRRPVLALGLMLVAVPAARPDEKKPAFVVTRDGKPAESVVITLSGRPGPPDVGDLIGLYDTWLVADDDPRWDLVSTGREDGLLYRRRPSGREVVHVRVENVRKRDDWEIVNPLAKMTREEKARLQGVTLEEWNDDIARSLDGIDFARVALTVGVNVAGKSGALPALPAEVRYLIVEEVSNHGIKDYARLGDLKELRVLRVFTMTAPIPAGQVAKLKHLRHLETNQFDPAGGDLSALAELRTLRLGYCKDLTDVGFVRHCPGLVELDVRQTAVKDLRPLDGLKNLAVVRANEAPVAELPRKVPALTRLDVLSTKLTDAAVAAFRKDHPACVVRHRWEAALREAAGKADRVRVRTGGTCHRDISKEKTLADVKDPAAVRALLAAVRIDESTSKHHCMCCGQPSLEFYEGDRLVLTLGVHHGVALRWVDGWPADGALAGDSNTKITDWLADRGVTGPKEEAERAGRQKAAADRRVAQIDAAIPKAVRAKLDMAKSPDEAVAAFEDTMDGPTRAAVSFRLLGLGEGSWNLSSSAEQFVTIALLPRVKAADLAAAAKAAKDPVELAGAGRWLFFEKKWEKLPRDGRDELLKPIAEAALAHPRQLNRRRTMAELKAMGTPAARELLRRALRSEFTPRPLDKADETEPPGSVVFSPGDGDLDKGSDAAQAARLLAELGDATIKAEIEKRLPTATGDDRAIYEAALKKLGK